MRLFTSQADLYMFQNDKLLTARQIAVRWGVTTGAVLQKFRNGKLPGLRLGHRVIRFRLSDLIRFETEAQR